MTTWQLNEDQALADAIGAAIGHASPDAITGLQELRSAATPRNGYHVAHVDWRAREPVARALRATAAAGHPLAGRLEGLAAGLEQSLAARAMNT